MEGILKALERADGYHVWNLGGSRTVTLSDLIDKIGDRLGVTPRIRAMDPQPGDVERTWADIARVRAELDWEPRVEIDEGLDRFVDWYREMEARG